MSKPRKTLYIVCAAIFQILQIFTNAAGQDRPITVEIDVSDSKTAVILGRSIGQEPRHLYFLRSIAGINGVADRITDVTLSDAGGSLVEYRKLIAGEYLPLRPISAWRYRKSLEPMDDRRSAAHISWISNDAGLLLLRDLLPQTLKGPVVVQLLLPPNWMAATTEFRLSETRFEIADIEDVVFHIGRFRSTKSAGFDTQISGEWLFDDNDANVFIAEIIAEYRKIFGPPHKAFSVNVLKFPQKVPYGEWQAETIGSTVTIVSSDMPFKTGSVQRLHEQLRHELFHLWIPNGLSLKGNYAWFYEGFALYQSLKTGVAVNRISFSDLLDTLSRAANVDVFAGGRSSLIDASNDRTGGSNNTRIYARGMVVAFLCDAVLMHRSKGKRNIGDVLGTIVREHGSKRDVSTNGSDAVLAILMRDESLRPIVEKFIQGAEIIDLSVAMKAFGLENAAAAPRTELRVRKKPNGRQKDLLDNLGYNNWRKVSPIKK